PAHRRQVRLRHYVLWLRRLYGDLLHHRRVLPAGNEREDAGRNRSALRRSKNRKSWMRSSKLPWKCKLARRSPSRRRSRDLDHIGLSPLSLSVRQLQPVHRNFQLLVIHYNQQVVIVNFFALERIARRALDGISVGRASPGNKIGDATMLVTLVVVNVSREAHETGAHMGLAFFQRFAQVLFRGSRRMSAAKHFCVG